MAKPFWTVDQIVDNLNRNGEFWQGDTISYSFLESYPVEYLGTGFDFEKFPSRGEYNAKQALQLWDDVIAVSLVSTSGPDGDIRFGGSRNFEAAGSALPGTVVEGRDIGGDIWFHPHNVFSNTNGNPGSSAFAALIHEIGHALGFEHPGDYDSLIDSSFSYTNDAEYLQDSMQYTVMSYFKADETGADHTPNYIDPEYGVPATRGYQYPATPLLHDIAAAQAVYGADMTTRTGDTVYGFNSNTDRAVFEFEGGIGSRGGDYPVVAIWDAGGTDTLDFSGFTGATTLSLGAGSFSSTEWMTNNVAIAFGVEIENGIGGSGDDYILGNDLDNVLEGGDGNDTIAGAGGNDSLIGGAGLDSIFGNQGDDYISGGAGDDRLYGNDGNDRLLGGDGNDLLVGGINDDALDGGEGDDTLYGDDGADTLSGGIGNDELDGGVGAEDIAVFSGARADYEITRDFRGKFTVADLSADSGDEGTDSLINIEWLQFSDQTLAADSFAIPAPPDLVITGTEEADTPLAGDLGNDTIYGLGGNDRLRGLGGNDLLEGGSGDDYLGGDDGDDILRGGEGNDGLSGGFGNDLLEGGIGDDNLLGDAGDDTLRGGDGNDNLGGGSGSNLLYGDAGADRLHGGHSVDTLFGGEDADTLTGNGGNDFLQGDGGNDRLLGGDGDDQLFGGADDDSLLGGLGADSLNGGDGNDFLQGDGGNDTLLGGAGDDQLSGGADDDSLLGGLGADSLSGGEGNDWHDGGDGNDTVVFSGNRAGYEIARDPFGIIIVKDLNASNGDEGEDRIALSVEWLKFSDQQISTSSSEIPAPPDLVLEGTAIGDTLFGGLGDDVIFGRAGDDELYGSDGDDTLIGEGGYDTLFGGAGIDTAVFLGARDDYQIAFHNDFTSVRYQGADENKLSERDIVGTDVERLAFSDGVWELGNLPENRALPVPPAAPIVDISRPRGEIIHGDSGNDTLLGRGGKDRFYGHDGDDLLAGGDGRDTLIGGAGIDTIVGQNGRDVILGGADRDYIHGGRDADRLYGEDGDDVLVGHNGNDRVYGGAGHDVMSGGRGNDRLYGQDGNDIISASSGNDRVYGGSGDDRVSTSSGNDRAYGEAGNDYISAGSGNDRAYGGDGDDRIVGGSGNDRLYGEAGNDYISAGSGNDRVYGGSGDDRIIGGKGNDRLYGNDGNDVISGTRDSNRIYGGTGNDILVGGRHADRIYGESDDDSIYGGNGEDRLYGQDGNDFIDGGSRMDRLYGGAGNDTLAGGRHNDRLYGQSGDDTLVGGSGRDTMVGGTGDDVYFTDGRDRIIESAGQGIDTVVVGRSWGLASNLENLELTGTANISGVGNSLNNYLWGNSGGNVLIGGAGEDTLDGWLGNDLLVGGDDSDVFLFSLSEDEGDDVIQDFNRSEDILAFDNVIDGAGDDIADIDAQIMEIINEGDGGDVVVKFDSGTDVTFDNLGSGMAGTLGSIADLVDDTSQISTASALGLGAGFFTSEGQPGDLNTDFHIPSRDG